MMQAAVKWILATLTFLSEIVLWLGIGRVVWRMLEPVNSTLAKVAGVLAIIAIIILWAIFLSPKAEHRLSLYARILVISILTIVTGYLLYRGGDKAWGWLMMIPLTLIQAIGQYVMHDM